MIDGLTPRERECLAKVVEGETNKEIARDLGIKPETVNSHLVRAYLRLGLDGVGQGARVLAAVMWAQAAHEERT